MDRNNRKGLSMRSMMTLVAVSWAILVGLVAAGTSLVPTLAQEEDAAKPAIEGSGKPTGQVADQSVSEAIENAKEATNEAIDAAKQTISEAIDQAKHKATSALATKKEATAKAMEKAGEATRVLDQAAEAARDVLDKAKQATEELLEKAKEAVQRGSESDQSSGSTPAPAPPASSSGD
jgi:methyl-accepting chemotaxis protein